VAAIKKVLLSFVLAAALEASALAATSLDLVLNYLSQGGKGGRQVYDGSGDQDLTIYEPVLYVNHEIDSKTAVFGSVVYDLLSSASNKAFDTGTGASEGGWQDRKAVNAGYSKRAGDWMFTPTLGFSTELSYKSLSGGLNVQRFFAEENFVLSAGIFHYADQAKPWDISAGAFRKWQDKTTDSVNLSATQLLSERDMVLAGVSYTSQSGYLEGTRNTVDTGSRVEEALPGSREKYTLSGRYVRSLRENLALHLDYRYYTDSWDIKAHTFEPALAVSFAEDKGIYRVFYRLHSQSEARYYQDSFLTGARTYMTSDSDLDKFSANEAGVQFTYAPERWEGMMGGDWTWGGTALYYDRSNDLDALIMQLSLGVKF
jgi:hypothetical protein